MKVGQVTSLETRAPRLTGVIIGILLAAGSAYAFSLGSRLMCPDEQDYVTLANEIAGHARYTLDGIHPTAYRPPGYPLLLSLPAALGGGIVAMRLLNMLALGVSVLLMFRIAIRMGGPRAAVLAAACMALYPLNLYTAGTLYPQTVATTLWLFAIDLTWRNSISPYRAAALGLISGILLLMIPNFLAPLLLVWGWAVFRQKPQQRWLAAIALLAGVVLVLTPWTIRNYRSFGACVPFSTNSGINLLLGNSAQTTPNSGVNLDLESYDRDARKLDEISRNQYYTEAALDYVRAHPGQSVRLYILKFLNYFNFQNTLHTSEESSIVRNVLLFACYVPLLCFAFWRCIAAARAGRLSGFQLFCLAAYVLNGAAQAVFFTRIRFRVPFDALLILLAVIPFPVGNERGRGGTRPSQENSNWRVGCHPYR